MFGPADRLHLHVMTFNIRLAHDQSRPGDHAIRSIDCPSTQRGARWLPDAANSAQLPRAMVG